MAALVTVRLGRCIPLPGLRPEQVAHLVGGNPAALARVSIFCLGMMPIIWAMLLCEMAKLGSGTLRRWLKASNGNAQTFNAFMILGALVIASVQASSLAVVLEYSNMLTSEPAWLSRAQIVASVVAATALLAWMGEALALGGLAGGFWLLYVIPWLAEAPLAMKIYYVQSSALGRDPLRNLGIAAAFLVLAIIVLVVVCMAGYSQRDSSRTLLRRTFSNPLVFDVWPPLLATATVALMAWAIAFCLHDNEWGTNNAPLAYGQPLHVALIALLIAAFTALRASGQRAETGCPATRLQVCLTALAQIALCGSSEILVMAFDVPIAADGPELIIIFACALGFLSSLRAVPHLPTRLLPPGAQALIVPGHGSTGPDAKKPRRNGASLIS